VADAKDPRRLRDARPLACTPSYEEAMAVLAEGDGRGRAERWRAVAGARDRILAASGATIAVVTLDADGSVVLERGRPARRINGERVAERCSAGAGDTFTAALTLGLLAGGDAATAAELASAAAAVVVAKPGTATCSLAELRRRLLPDGSGR
jgi:sugar/nucleoside kinase (ribokinase family)